MKILVVLLFLCGEPVGIITNNDAIRYQYQNPSEEVNIPPRELIDIARLDVEKISGLQCI